ncbi:MAG: hypothetical protein ACOYNS_17680 [Bacteroidota bacterium]
MRTIIIFCTLFTLCTVVITAQPSAYLYSHSSSMMPEHSTILRYDAAYSEKNFRPFGADNMEQTIGLRTTLNNSFTVVAHAGIATTIHGSRMMQQAELIADVFHSNDGFTGLAAGAGARHEYDGTNVMLVRALADWRSSSWNVSGNVLLEKAFSASRDQIDLMTTVGVNYALSSVFHAGLEIVGQDLEGFWDTEEAEGGAVVYAGPSIGTVIPGMDLHITVGGGPIIRASQNDRIGTALREIPAVTGNGFVVRTSLSFGI